jgi:translation initiation factor IF-3
VKNIVKSKKVDPRTSVKDRNVRLIDSEGEQLGIMLLKEALARAEERNLDLVEVASNADPPVCRMMDYDKIRYRESKRAQEAKKKQCTVQVKEVRIRPNTDEHDFQFKLRHIRRFLEDKNKAKISIIFRGREIVHSERGKELLERIADEIEDIGVVEQLPRLEGRNMTMIISPKS